jgi:hypothetical protein
MVDSPTAILDEVLYCSDRVFEESMSEFVEYVSQISYSSKVRTSPAEQHPTTPESHHNFLLISRVVPLHEIVFLLERVPL